MSSPATLTVMGARGTLPVAGLSASRYGGNTSCLAVRTGERAIVLDAGSGIVPLGRSLLAEGVREIDVLLTHAHYDHVLGLPFFAPLFAEGASVRLWYAGDPVCPDAEALLGQLIRAPFLPFAPEVFRAGLSFGALPRAGAVELSGGLRVVTAPVHHPGGSLAVRVEGPGATAVYVPDFEHDDGPMDAALTEVLRGADLAFLDTTYLPDEYPGFRGFGHSHWRRCAEIAAAAGVTRWGAFHHAPDRSDAALHALEGTLAEAAPGAFVTREGMVFDL